METTIIGYVGPNINIHFYSPKTTVIKYDSDASHRSADHGSSVYNSPVGRDIPTISTLQQP